MLKKLLSAAVVLGAPLGLGIAAMAMFIAYRNRIRAEEVALAAHFGERWVAFARGRRRLMPMVW